MESTQMTKADEIKELRDDIRAFVRECEEKQHTDTCAAHDLLNDCEDMLGQLVMSNQELCEQLITLLEKQKEGWKYSTRSDSRYIDGYNRCLRLVRHLLQNYTRGK